MVMSRRWIITCNIALTGFIYYIIVFLMISIGQVEYAWRYDIDNPYCEQCALDDPEPWNQKYPEWGKFWFEHPTAIVSYLMLGGLIVLGRKTRYYSSKITLIGLSSFLFTSFSLIFFDIGRCGQVFFFTLLSLMQIVGGQPVW